MENLAHNQSFAPKVPRDGFQRAYDALDRLAADIVGTDWGDDTVFGAMISKTVKYPLVTNADPTSDIDNFGVTEYGFEATKYPTGSSIQSYFNDFEISISDSRPFDFTHLSRNQYSDLVEGFIECFQDKITDILKTVAESDTDNDIVFDADGEVDIDQTDSSEIINACRMAADDNDLDIILKHNITYNLREIDHHIGYEETKSVISGNIYYELTGFKSRQNYEQQILYQQTAPDFISYIDDSEVPESESLTSSLDIADTVFDRDTFDGIIEQSFSEGDIMAVDLGLHAKNIIEIIKILRGNRY